MYCNKCGNKVDDNQRFCVKCGNGITPPPKVDINTYNAPKPVSPQPQSPPAEVSGYNNVYEQKAPKKKMSKGKKAKIIAIAVLSGVLVLAVCLTIMFFTSSAYSVYKSFNANELDEAVSEYRLDVQDSFVQKTLLNMLLGGQVDKTLSDFKNGETDYDNAIKALEILEEMNFEEAKTASDELIAINNANIAYEKADEYYQKGDYENAISEYSKIPESDENYQEVQTKLDKVYADYVSSTVETAKNHNIAKNYKLAIKAINIAYEILPDDVDTSELAVVKEESLTAYRSEVSNEVTKLIEDNQWTEAFEIIDEAIAFDDNEFFKNIKDTTAKTLVSVVDETVKSYLNGNEYSKALNMVKSALAILPENEELKELQKTVEKNTPVYLEDVFLIDSSDYSYIDEVFTDSFGNIYDGYHWFDAYYGNAYAVYNLNENYSRFNCSIVSATTTSSNTTFTVYIYLDGKLAYTLSDFKKTTGKKDISINVSNVTKLEIKTKATEKYNSRLAMVNATLVEE